MTIVGPNPRIRVEPNKPRKWTEPEDKLLRALWTRGDTAKAIGLVVGRTSGSVLQRAYYLRFEKRAPGRKSTMTPADSHGLVTVWNRGPSRSRFSQAVEPTERIRSQERPERPKPSLPFAAELARWWKGTAESRAAADARLAELAASAKRADQERKRAKAAAKQAVKS